MVKEIAYRLSATVLLVTALAIVAMLVMGLTRAIASESEESSPTPVPIAKKAIENRAIENKAMKTDSAEPVKLHDTAVKTTTTETVSGAFTVKRILEINEPFVHGFWKWDDEGVPNGEVIITVDLKAESISVFRDGYEIGAAVITFGDAKKPTPTGVFPITQKSKDHISNIYGTPMPYMLRMTNDGISIHGTEVEWGWGTRGCIGVPNEFAALLFEQVKLGDRIIVTDGKMLKLGGGLGAI